MSQASDRTVRTVALVAVMTIASEIVLAAVFYFSGAVTPEKAHDMVKVLRGELASPTEAEGQAEKPREPFEIKSQEELQKAAEAFRASRAQREQSLALEKDAVESMKRELESIRKELDERERDLKERVTAFQKARSAEEKAAKDAAFAEAVATYAAMEPKRVAELLYDLDDTKVVRYLRAFKTDFRAEVLTEVKKVDDAKQANRQGEPNRAATLQETISGDAATPPGAVVSARARE